MTITYRKLTPADLDTFISMRITQLREEGATEDIDPGYRRMGIVRELLDRVVNESRKYGCGAVHITASDMGVKLYTAYGFVHNGNFMQYKL